MLSGTGDYWDGYFSLQPTLVNGRDWWVQHDNWNFDLDEENRPVQSRTGTGAYITMKYDGKGAWEITDGEQTLEIIVLMF